MKTKSIHTVSVFALAAVLLCGSPTRAAAPAPSLTNVEERFVTSKSGNSVRATFGRLSVPEVRSDPESGTIELAFVRLHSEAADPLPPVVYLAGGPGGSSTWQADHPEFEFVGARLRRLLGR